MVLPRVLKAGTVAGLDCLSGFFYRWLCSCWLLGHGFLCGRLCSRLGHGFLRSRLCSRLGYGFLHGGLRSSFFCGRLCSDFLCDRLCSGSFCSRLRGGLGSRLCYSFCRRLGRRFRGSFCSWLCSRLRYSFCGRLCSGGLGCRCFCYDFRRRFSGGLRVVLSCCHDDSFPKVKPVGYCTSCSKKSCTSKASASQQTG